MSQLQNVTIFAPSEAFQQKEPRDVGRQPRIDQEESEDVEMQAHGEPPQKLEGDEEEVSEIINTYNFSNVFLAKALQRKNIRVLKRAYRKHLKDAAKVKRILKKLGEKVLADSDSSDSSDEHDLEDISRNALNTYSQVHKKWHK